MIAFACAHCGMKFQVKDEFAGRTCRCPTCKDPLVVPAPDATVAYIPDGPIDGTSSSIAESGLEGGVTLEQAGSQPQTGQKTVRELLACSGKDGTRYVVAGEIARGGMGIVLRAIDRDIRREVAVKYLLDQTDPHLKRRFVEEVQITGQLEHPNIVPIHELGMDSQKRLFFSMKMVQGRSLAQVLDELRNKPKMAEKEYPLGRLLNVFVNVCNAMTYAHARGVVHRDLKPANIMLGDFGEVYVMDWGLAKVVPSMGQTASAKPVAAAPAAIAAPSTRGMTLGSSPSATAAVSPQAIPVTPGPVVYTSGSGQVVTNRVDEMDLTQPGSVLGTPVYMPPEQALGQVGDIDARSDVYALGAILYEILTLQAPVAKEGGRLLILYRVTEGQIQSPEERAPQRARAGQIPRELSAVARKALAREKAHRYQAVEALRQDIERYQQGRSVSAKHDSVGELLWKLIKRNRAASIAAAAVLLVLLVSAGAVVQAWGRTRSAYTKYQKEQGEKEARTRKAVPAFVKAARHAADQKDFDGALSQVSVALDYDADNADARLLKGQLLIVRQDFTGARTELEQYLRMRKDDANAKRLAELCQALSPEDPATLLALAQVFIQQRASALADGLLTQHGQNSFAARKQLLELYQQRIEKAWPGLGTKLSMDPEGIFTLNCSGSVHVLELEPLRGMPLTSLNLARCPIKDLSPLRGMPLAKLNLYYCTEVKDLSPLRGMPLTSLDVSGCNLIDDLTPLRGMPLKSLHLKTCVLIKDLTPLQGMPLESLDLAGCTGVDDLTPLSDLRLTFLILTSTRVRDLTPLKGMPLSKLYLNGCKQIRDLSPLQGMNLTVIWPPLPLVANSNGMDILREMKSLQLIIMGSAKNYPPDEFWKRYDAGEFKPK